MVDGICLENRHIAEISGVRIPLYPFMYLLIVFLPLLSAFISGMFGRLITEKGSTILTTSSIFVTFLLSCFAFYEVALCNSPCYIEVCKWMVSDIVNISWSFQFDSLTVTMLVVVTCISTLVHLYSIGYMHGDPHIPRFMSYLSLFTFFMLMLVTSDNFVQMFVGWEGVGLCSYLLINFWFTRLQANKAAIKAMLVNRVGDFGLIIGMLAIFYTFKTLDYSTVFALAPNFINTNFSFFNINFDLLNFICILLFIGAIGKSAQVGLHVWLPDAMEGPTPVSALIHAATMVTAGVFMISRCSPLFEYASNALIVVTVIGAITAFFAATTGLLQNDMKRVIAYSTCSQLGYMIFACGISGYNVGIFHLANHAFFKALLFLSAGSVIHAMNDEQDMRKMGGLMNILPLTYSMVLIGSLALLGFPFLSGYYSKDVILELAFAKYTISSHFAYWLGTISAFFTAFYSIRLLFLTFLTKTNAYKQTIMKAHDAPIVMALPLIILSILSIFIGYFTKDMLIGLGTTFWNNAIFVLPSNTYILEAEFLPFFFKILPVILSILGALLGYICYGFLSTELHNIKTSKAGMMLYTFLNRKWFFDKIYAETFYQSTLFISSEYTYKLLDKGFFNLLGPRGLTNLLSHISTNILELQSGFFYNYAFVFLMGLTCILLLNSTFIVGLLKLSIILLTFYVIIKK